MIFNTLVRKSGGGKRVVEGTFVPASSINNYVLTHNAGFDNYVFYIGRMKTIGKKPTRVPRQPHQHGVFRGVYQLLLNMKKLLLCHLQAIYTEAASEIQAILRV